MKKKELRDSVENHHIKAFMLKQSEDFTRLYEEVQDSHNLGIIEALNYKLKEINKELINLRNSEGDGQNE